MEREEDGRLRGLQRRRRVSTEISGVRKDEIPARYRLRVEGNRWQRDWKLSEVVDQVLRLKHWEDIDGVLNRWAGRFARKNFPLLIQERSVSTILYLISLQDLTNCPFRVVDEINQGMDPINERKMFQQLVRAASQPNTPQCFLLTPKLLPDLQYSDACSILNIMNGPWIEESAQVWSNGEFWRTVTGL